jgi:ergothioneine biosynthesis protein EgtB
MIQSMPDASPTKWHLAHTSWFFEAFILKPRGICVQPNDQYDVLFNSYYHSLGPQFPRPQRHLISKPNLTEVWVYRHAVEEALERCWAELNEEELACIELGINHEQQHQELIVTDIKHAFSQNPLAPVIVNSNNLPGAFSAPLQWRNFSEGNYLVGTQDGFHFDNESPQHKVFLQGFRLANRPVTNQEYLAFITDKGYQRPTLWLSEGWAWVQKHKAEAPLYWQKEHADWVTYTLSGMRPLNIHEPVCHLTYYEANAFAAWAGKRLPTEYEWEVAANTLPVVGNFLDLNRLHPSPSKPTGSTLLQMFGDVWQWTQSAYQAYPGFRAEDRAIGEYNGKFMVNQWVLRGGSCATSPGHIRPSYRNFFPVSANWQFSGVRLADECN